MNLLAWAPGMWEVVLILGVFLLFFGSSRLPRMARSLGSSLTEFKKGLRGDPDEDDAKKNLPDQGERTGDDAGDREKSDASSGG